MKKTVLVGGYFGFGNLGDELILAAMLHRLREERRDLAFIVASGEPAATSADHGVRAVSWTDLPGLVAAAEEVDLVLLGGGGVFHDYWGADPESLLRPAHLNIPYYMAFPLLATLAAKPLMIYAVGVGPLFSQLGRELTRVSFEQASVATVRDQGSLDLLKEAGADTGSIVVTADPVFDLPGSPEVRAEAKGGPVVAVALRNWTHGVSAPYWERQVAEALDAFLDQDGGRVVFVPFMRGGEPFGDVPVSERVAALLKGGRHEILSVDLPPEERAAALSRCDMVLGMRLHAALLGMRAALPTVALVYDPKVASAMEEAGAGRFSVDIGALKARALAATLGEAWRGRAEASRQFSALRHARQAAARETAKRALALLEKPVTKPMSAGTQGVLRDMTLWRVREEQRLLAELARAAEEQAQSYAERVRLHEIITGLHGELEVHRARGQEVETLRGELLRWETSRLGRLMLRYRAWRWRMSGQPR